jgi:hypothetical protein
MTITEAAAAAEYHYAEMQLALADYRTYGDSEYLELAQYHKRQLDAARAHC